MTRLHACAEYARRPLHGAPSRRDDRRGAVRDRTCVPGRTRIRIGLFGRGRCERTATDAEDHRHAAPAFAAAAGELVSVNTASTPVDANSVHSTAISPGLARTTEAGSSRPSRPRAGISVSTTTLAAGWTPGSVRISAPLTLTFCRHPDSCNCHRATADISLARELRSTIAVPSDAPCPYPHIVLTVRCSPAAAPATIRSRPYAAELYRLYVRDCG
jgi:hypothetical protein